jgi:hypothetical protein
VVGKSRGTLWADARESRQVLYQVFQCCHRIRPVA